MSVEAMNRYQAGYSDDSQSTIPVYVVLWSGGHKLDSRVLPFEHNLEPKRFPWVVL